MTQRIPSAFYLKGSNAFAFYVEKSYNKFTKEVNCYKGVGLLEIEYKSKRLEKICTIAAEAEKHYGKKMAAKIQQRIDEISAAASVEMMILCRIGRCHALKGDRKNQYALDLVHPYRLIFEKKGNEIQIAKIQEIVDYH